MTPSILDCMSPTEALSLFAKIASEEGPQKKPEVERPPSHPYVTAFKQLIPIGLGTAAGYAVGAGGPHALRWASQKFLHKELPTPSYNTLGLISAVAGTVGGLAANILSQARKAEADRANAEYQSYHERRARDRAGPTVQPPSIRS